MRFSKDFPALHAASRLSQPLSDGLAGFGRGRPRRLAQGGEEGVKAGSAHGRSDRAIEAFVRVFRSGQPVPCGQKVRRCLVQRFSLVGQELQRQPGVQHRVIQSLPLQLPVLVVLHQPMVRIAGKGQRIEPERVNRRQAQQAQPRPSRLQVGQIEGDQVVAYDVGCALGKVVQSRQRRCHAATAVDQRPCSSMHRGEGVDATALAAHLQIQGQATGGQIVHSIHRRRTERASVAMVDGAWRTSQAPRQVGVLHGTLALGPRASECHERPLHPRSAELRPHR